MVLCQDAGRQKVLFEVGCGVGNFMFPLLEEDETRSLFIYACDFSQRAIQFVKVRISWVFQHLFIDQYFYKIFVKYLLLDFRICITNNVPTT